MLTLIAQRRHDECHVGCVLTVLSGFISQTSYKEIKKQMKGNSLYDMRLALESFGVEAISFNLDLSNILDCDFDIMIAQTKDKFSSHFVVIEREFNNVFYYDPAVYQRKKINKKIIAKLSGYVLAVISRPTIKKPRYIYQVHYRTKIIIFTIVFVIGLIILISL